jgi:hypothetical protein
MMRVTGASAAKFSNNSICQFCNYHMRRSRELDQLLEEATRYLHRGKSWISAG